MKNFGKKTLEQTIKELQARYKNVPSPLSEQYKSFKTPLVPQQKPINFVETLVDGFKPTPKQW